MKYPRTGFTLIEMLVTISVMGLLISIAAPTYKSYDKFRALKNSTELMETVLGQAFSGARSYPHKFTVAQVDSTHFSLTESTTPPTTQTHALPKAMSFPVDSPWLPLVYTPSFGDIETPVDNANFERDIIVCHASGECRGLRVYLESGLVTRFDPAES